MPPLTRFRALPWLALIDVARTTKTHVDLNLSAADRKRVAKIASKTKGDVRKLSERDKADLKRIARDLNLAMLARDLVPTAGRLRSGRRR
jgi:hypothetical protein